MSNHLFVLFVLLFKKSMEFEGTKQMYITTKYRYVPPLAGYDS